MRIMRKSIYTFALALISMTFAFTSCCSSIPVESHWSVETLYANGNSIEIPAGHNPGISFLKGNKIAGETGCNRFFGDYESDGEKIIFTNMGSTRMMCPQMEFENSYMQALGNIASFTITQDTLTFKDKEGNIIAILKKTEPNALEN